MLSNNHFIGIAILGKEHKMNRNNQQHREVIFADKPTFESTWFVFIVILLTIIIDCFMLHIFFQDSLRAQGLQLLLLIFGTAVVIDITPAFLGFSLRKAQYEKSAMAYTICFILLALMISVIGSLYYFRLAYVTSQENVHSESSLTVGSTLLFVMIPIGTSLLNFVLSYSSYDPQKKLIRKAQREIADLNQAHIDLQSELEKYESYHGDYKNDLILQERLRYSAQFDKIMATSHRLKTYFRSEIKKKIPDPAAMSALSTPVPQSIHLAMLDTFRLEPPISSLSTQIPMIKGDQKNEEIL